ncbi:hypothetical protein [Roseivirga spongicola]|uniref:hypothetical protein n=1 Tax=Roseivirga spongicola TaxID=333140 RepID=UPI002AC979FA|nr:hypothetical protein [Roseivirga spongicola]WPZ08795.1 hypothetical protein T7867_11050 [Roseivirga spongicola]
MNRGNKEKMYRAFVDMMESIHSVQHEMVVEELRKINHALSDLSTSASDVRYMRPKMIESVYGIKRTTLENHARNGVLSKYKLFGCVVFSVREIEDAIVPVR